MNFLLCNVVVPSYAVFWKGALPAGLERDLSLQSHYVNNSWLFGPHHTLKFWQDLVLVIGFID